MYPILILSKVLGLKSSSEQLLFLQSAVAKLDEQQGRAAIIENGSPLFTGGTASGESQVRRWLLENDLTVLLLFHPTDFLVYPAAALPVYYPL